MFVLNQGVKIKFHPLVEKGTMLKVNVFPFEPEVHFNYDERYKIVFNLHDTLDEAFPMIQSVARLELYEILKKYE